MFGRRTPLYQLEPGEFQPSTVSRWWYPPQFGSKQLTPPPAPDALFLPTVYGPNYEGQLDGALLTPAIVRGVVDDDGTVRDVPVASVSFTLTAGDILSNVKIGILPYKEA